MDLPGTPSGLTLSSTRLFITCATPESSVYIVDLKKWKIVKSLKAGHTAISPRLSPDGKRLYICNRFDNDVSVFDVGKSKELKRIPVQREPVALAVTPDGKHVLVANHLPVGRADVENVASVISVIDTKQLCVVKELKLPQGSVILKDIEISPDGRLAVVTHQVASYQRAATRVTSGWINANAMTVIDVAKLEPVGTILLDEPNRGAANPWGAAWMEDRVAITHAGTHEISVIDINSLLANWPIKVTTKNPTTVQTRVATYISHYEGLDPGLPYLTGARERIALPKDDFGPRAVTVLGQKIYTANYFSDTLSEIDLTVTNPVPRSIALGPKIEMTTVRKGEFYFNDARLCQQGWQSCVSCHPDDARADGLNWDLANDGIGNPKNTRSLLNAHKTGPAMSLGVRDNAEAAVRAGIKFILFTQQPESIPAAMDEYLKSLNPIPSPHLEHGRLSTSAKRGQKTFQRLGCTECHPPGLYTDMAQHNVGTNRGFDRTHDRFYTLPLIELWRTAPYLHDGSAATVRDVLTTRDPKHQHSDVSTLSSKDLDDLCEFLLSL